MNNTKDKRVDIKWWHLWAGGIGINILAGGTSILGDLLIAFGLAWGVLLLIKHVYRKAVKKDK